MPFFSKKADQWVVLDDQKNVLFSNPDREAALAYFKSIATKPENTCPHRLTVKKFRWVRPPVIESVLHKGIFIRDEGQSEFYRYCQNCQKEIADVQG